MNDDQYRGIINYIYDIKDSFRPRTSVSTKYRENDNVLALIFEEMKKQTSILEQIKKQNDLLLNARK